MPMKKKEKKSATPQPALDAEQLSVDAFLAKDNPKAAAKCARFLSDDAMQSLLDLKYGRLSAVHEQALLNESERRYDAAMDGDESSPTENAASASVQFDNPIFAEIPEKKSPEPSEDSAAAAAEDKSAPEMAEPPKWEALAGRTVQGVVMQLCPNPQYVIVLARLKIGSRMATYSGTCSIPHKYRPFFRQYGKILKVEFLPVKNKFAFVL